MKQHQRIIAGIASIAVSGLWSAAVMAAATPASISLNTCQNTLATQAIKRFTREVTAFKNCFQKMSNAVIKNQDAGTAALVAAPYCVKQISPVCDQRSLGKSTGEKFYASVFKKCNPGQPRVSHTLPDITGKGGSLLPQALNTKYIDTYCAGLSPGASGTGSIDGVDDWLSCFNAWPGGFLGAMGPAPGVVEAIAHQYPRAVEWSRSLSVAMNQVPGPADYPTRGSDAADCILRVATNSALQDIGAHDNAVINACSTRMPATGDTSVHQADKNDDGIFGSVTVQADLGGQSLWYHDNGDGTVSDLNTGLMWEKKGDNGGLHDKDNVYQYDGDGLQETIWDWLDDVNVEGGTGFAGHNDWRIPNVKELQSIVNYGAELPAVSSEFNTGCIAGCTVTSCSCTQTAGFYWSSTTEPLGPSYAWSVRFADGAVDTRSKANNYNLRAVRGGL